MPAGGAKYKILQLNTIFTLMTRSITVELQTYTINLKFSKAIVHLDVMT